MLHDVGELKPDPNAALIKFAGDELFVGITPSGHGLVLDTNHDRSAGPSPIELLLIALGSCTAVDVITILKKQRQTVTNYVVEVAGVRREEHPRSYESMSVRHVLTGKSISPDAVQKAIELSEWKYCSVAATLRPTVKIQSSFQIIEADE
ncbi:MAG: OsmC family protein [Pyrinomonadaceae bacterium]